MTGPDLIRLAEELARCGGVHRLTSLVTAAVHVCLEHERRGRTVESWEDGPCGVGMSDKAVREPFVTAPGGKEIIDRYRAERDAASRLPAAEEPSGRATEAQGGRGQKSNDLQTTQKPVLITRIAFPESNLRTGNALSDERGVTHGPGSKIAREFGRPVNPEDCGDGA